MSNKQKTSTKTSAKLPEESSTKLTTKTNITPNQTIKTSQDKSSKKSLPSVIQAFNKPLILGVTGAALALIVVGGIIMLAKSSGKSETAQVELPEEAWTKQYYTTIRALQDDNDLDYLADVTDIRGYFYQANDDREPTLVLTYEKDGKPHADTFQSNSAEKSAAHSNYVDSEVVLLYNLNDKTYDYYISIPIEGSEEVNYLRFGDMVSASASGAKHVIVNPENDDTAKDADGKEVTLTDFDKKFIIVEDSRPGVEFRKDFTEQELVNFLQQVSAAYEPRQSLIDKADSAVKEKIIALEQKQAQITKLKAAEKAKTNKEKQRPSGIKVGSDFVKFGRYKGSNMSSAEGNTLILNANGTASLSGNFGNSGTSDKYNYTYKIGTYDFTQDPYSSSVRDAILLYLSDGTMARALYVYNGKLHDGGVGIYEYVGE